MKWWGRKAGAAPRPALLRGLGLASWPAAAEAGWPRSYEAQVRDAFLTNPVAQRAVRLVAEGVASCTSYDEAGAGAQAPAPLMFGRLTERAERAGKQRAAELRTELAQRLSAELPAGVQIEVTGDGVRLSGRGIAARFALEPGLRWLLARIR